MGDSVVSGDMTRPEGVQMGEMEAGLAVEE